MARPTSYTPELADQICDALASGTKTLRELCRDEGMPAEATVRGWVLDDREGFAAKYARARELGYHSMFDEIIEIADDGTNDWVERKRENGEGSETVFDHEHLARSKLRVDTRKWALSKALPKMYGDRLDVNAKHDVSDGLADLMKAIDGKTRGLPKVGAT